MSMIGMFVRISSSELDSFITDSQLFENLLDDESFDTNPNICDIDKSWDAISYLLTGFGPNELSNATQPLSWTIFGAYVLDENQDLGYGPATYLTSEQVIYLDSELSKITLEDFKANYDADKMNKLGIYPTEWRQIEEEIDYIGSNFETLKKFYVTAAVEKQAVVCYLS